MLYNRRLGSDDGLDSAYCVLTAKGINILSANSYVHLSYFHPRQVAPMAKKTHSTRCSRVPPFQKKTKGKKTQEITCEKNLPKKNALEKPNANKSWKLRNRHNQIIEYQFECELFVVEESRNVCLLTERGRGMGGGGTSQLKLTIPFEGLAMATKGCRLDVPTKMHSSIEKGFGIGRKRCGLLGEGLGFVSFWERVRVGLDRGEGLCLRLAREREGGMGRKWKK